MRIQHLAIEEEGIEREVEFGGGLDYGIEEK